MTAEVDSVDGDRRLMLPTNWDPELLARVAPLRPAYLYGSLASDPTLRNSLNLPTPGKDEVATFIRLARQEGIKFVYVMNATCLGNREMSENGRFEILQRCQWLMEAGGVGVISANPFVMELVKEHFPDLELHVSVLAHVDHPRNAVFFEDLGADVIHLDPLVNRDFKRLKAIRKAVRCRLSALVNEGCTILCPIRNYHANVMSHSAESIDGKYHVDYCYYKCNLTKTADPAEYLRLPWIRPEDLGVYASAGIDLFKLAGREKMGGGPSSHTEWIVHAAEAYRSGRAVDIGDVLVAIDAVAPLKGRAVEAPKVHIDSSRLEGFLTFFQAGHCDFNCTRCRYCGDWAETAVTIEGNAASYAEQLQSTLKTLRIGSYWTGLAR
jgi:collagenase-like PrtC family protease